jgi:catechol 2,3-dioxygenase-like lactoylglutathione lyase family enzyme
MTPLLEVFDMPTAVSFYRDLVGFEVIARSGSDDNSDWVHLRLADVDLMLNTAYEVISARLTPIPRACARTVTQGSFLGVRTWTAPTPTYAIAESI